MLNHWKKLQVLCNSAKSIERDQALKSKISSVVQIVVKPTVKAEIAAPSESVAPVKRADAEISTSVAKTGVENPVQPSKASEVPLDDEFEKRIMAEVNSLKKTPDRSGFLPRLKLQNLYTLLEQRVFHKSPIEF